MDLNLSATNSYVGQLSMVIRIEYIQPGKPQQNAYIERYNRTMRYSWVSKHLFDTLEQVQDYATQWLWHYNHERPHQANGGKPPLMAA